MPIKSVWKTDKNAGICVLLQIGPTLKAKKLILMNKLKLCVLFNNVWYFFVTVYMRRINFGCTL